MPVGPASLASTMTWEDAIHLRGMYGVPNNVMIIVRNHSDRVTSSSEGGIALYKGFFHTRLCLPLHLFILSFLDHYWLFFAQLAPNAFRFSYSFIVLCHFHGIVARFLLFQAIYVLK